MATIQIIVTDDNERYEVEFDSDDSVTERTFDGELAISSVEPISELMDRAYHAARRAVLGIEVETVITTRYNEPPTSEQIKDAVDYAFKTGQVCPPLARVPFPVPCPTIPDDLTLVDKDLLDTLARDVQRHSTSLRAKCFAYESAKKLVDDWAGRVVKGDKE